MLATCRTLSFVAPFLCAAQSSSFISAPYHPPCSAFLALHVALTCAYLPCPELLVSEHFSRHLQEIWVFKVPADVRNAQLPPER